MGWFPINPFSNKSPLLCLSLPSPSFPLLPNTKKRLCPLLVLFWRLGNPSEQNYQKESFYKFPFWILPLYSMKLPFMKPSSPNNLPSHPSPPSSNSPPLFFATERKMNFVVIVIPWARWYLSTKLTENDSEYSPSHPIKFPYHKPPSLISRREALEINKFLAGLLERSWYCLN